jgi:hypothetical protein
MVSAERQYCPGTLGGRRCSKRLDAVVWMVAVATGNALAGRSQTTFTLREQSAVLCISDKLAACLWFHHGEAPHGSRIPREDVSQ